MAEVETIIDPDNGSGTDYVSLVLWEAGEQTDLVSAGNTHLATCRCTGGTADTDALTFDGWVTGASNYVTIWTDPGEGYRHNGTYETGNHYRLELTDDDFAVRQEYTRIEGLQVQLSYSADDSVNAVTYSSHGAANTCHLSDTIIRAGTISGVTVYRGLYVSDSDVTLHMWNCIIYGFDVSGCYGYQVVNGTVHTYNCTVADNDSGIRHSGGTITNCAVFDNNDDFASTSATIDYCASDDGDGTNAIDWDSESTDWDNNFEDYSTHDYNVVSGADVIGAGTDDPSSGLYSDDIAGETRTSTWDIGAFEYIAAGGGLSIPVAMHHRKQQGMA